MKIGKNLEKIIPYGLAMVITMIAMLPSISESIVLDEAYSILLVRGNVSEIIRGAAADVHPPLYYLIMRLTSLVCGESLLAYRLITAAATGLNLLWLGATVIRKRWGFRVSIIYILWFGFSFSTLEKSTLIRMYTWGCFFVTAAVLFLFAYYEKRKRRDFIFSIVYTLAAMYTHYYGVMAVFTAWCILGVHELIWNRKELRKVLLGGLFVAFGYLPWMKAFLEQSSRVANHYWIKTFEWQQWRNAPAALMECSLQGLGIVLCMLATVAMLVAVVRRNWEALCSMTVFVGTMILGALMSILVTPIWQERYLYTAWGVFALAVALVLGEGKELYSLLPQCAVIGLLAVIGVFSVQTLLQNQILTTTADGWAAYVEENVKPGDCMIVDDPYEHIIIYQFYTENVEIVMTESLTGVGGTRELTDILEQYADKQVWYVMDSVQVRYGIEKIAHDLQEVGYELRPGVNFTIQDKNLDIYLVGENHNEE